MKKCLIGLLLIAGICGVVYLPSVFAADTQGKQNPATLKQRRLRSKSAAKLL